MWKKGVGFLVCLFLFCMGQKVFADLPVDMKVNLVYVDATCFIENGVTYAPLRVTAELLGASEIQWDADRSRVEIREGEREIVLYENDTIGYVNQVAVPLSGSAKIVEGRIYVPVRFVAESMSADVTWDGRHCNVLLEKDAVTVPEHRVLQEYDDADVLWMSRIIEAESRGEPRLGKIAVGNVVMNRVNSPDYPDTVYEVIFDMRYGVQFTPVSNGEIYNIPSDESVLCAKWALKNQRPVGACLYFFNPRKATSTWIIEHRPYFMTISNHDFYL